VCERRPLVTHVSRRPGVRIQVGLVGRAALLCVVALVPAISTAQTRAASAASATPPRANAAPASATTRDALLRAVKAGDRVAVAALLARRVDVNGAEADGTTPLHWAIERGDVEMTRMLVRAGASVTATNRFGATPLWLAAVAGNTEVMGILLEAGADPNATSAEGETVLMVAARTGRLDAVTTLLSRGANPNPKEGWRGQTALMWAAAEGHAPVVEALVKAGADLHLRVRGVSRPWMCCSAPARSWTTLCRCVLAATRRGPRMPRRNWGPTPFYLRLATRTTSWRRVSSIVVPTRTRHRRAIPRFTRCRGPARLVSPGATIPLRKDPGRWTA
jgi:hypothetical protein